MNNINLLSLFEDDIDQKSKDILIQTNPLQINIEVNQPKIIIDKCISYVYLYLDPRKPGHYIFILNGFKLEFDYEPFYVGKGTNNRWLFHVTEALKFDENIKILHQNIFKCRKIKKIIEVLV
jgi:hypothetical protein